MTLKERIQSDMKSAMKSGDKHRLKVVRAIHAAVKQVEVDTRADLDDAAITGVITKMVKQRQDSVAQFTDGGRKDLAEVEQAEIEVLQDYLPEPLSDDELDALIDQAIADTGASSLRDMGKVMAAVKSGATGRADMGAVSSRVKARLAG